MVGKEADEDGQAKEFKYLDLGDAKAPGVKCITEVDGLRVINSDGIFFVERVQDNLIETFEAFLKGSEQDEDDLNNAA